MKKEEALGAPYLPLQRHWGPHPGMSLTQWFWASAGAEAGRELALGKGAVLMGNVCVDVFI